MKERFEDVDDVLYEAAHCIVTARPSAEDTLFPFYEEQPFTVELELILADSLGVQLPANVLTKFAYWLTDRALISIPPAMNIDRLRSIIDKQLALAAVA